MFRAVLLSPIVFRKLHHVAPFAVLAEVVANWAEHRCAVTVCHMVGVSYYFWR